MAGPLAVLVCASFVACMIRFTLVELEKGNEIGADFRQALAFCLYALFVIGAVTIANMLGMARGQSRLFREAGTTRRKPFLLGVLSGGVAAIAVTLGFRLLDHGAHIRHSTAVTHATAIAPLSGEARVYPAISMVMPRDPVPPNWQRRDFNGVTYYIVPLACADRR